MIDIYYRLEVSKRGNVDKPIIFHVLGDMDMCGNYGDEIAQAKMVIFWKRDISPAKMMCQQEERDPHWLKDHGWISSFEVMLSPKQMQALYSEAKIPNDRKKGLVY